MGWTCLPTIQEARIGGSQSPEMPLEIMPALVPAGGKAAGRGARQQREGAAGST